MRLLSTLFLSVLIMPSAALAQQGSPVTVNLKEVVGLALQNSPVIMSFRKDVDASSARLAGVRSLKGLKLSVRSDYGYINKETSFLGVPVLEKNTMTGGLILEKLIYSGGRVESALDQAGKERLAASENSLAAEDFVTARVAEAYLRTRMAFESISAARESLSALQASFDAAQKLREAGLVTKADVLRAEVELASAKEKLLTAENSYKVTLAGLKTAAGLDQSVELKLDNGSSDLAGLDPNGIESRERHDIAGMKAAVEAANAGTETARSANLPQVYIQADTQRIVKGAFFPRQKDSSGFGLAIRFPIWDSGAATAGVAEARSMLEKTEQDLRGLIQAAQLETESAKLDFESAQAKAQASGTRVSAAEESLRTLQAGYSEGLTPLTDVLAAQSALENARYAKIATNYEVQMAVVRMLKARGRTDLLRQ